MNTLQKGYNIVRWRIRTQGLGTTLIWAYGRGLPKLTGIPMAQYSRITRQIYVGPQYRQWGKRYLARLGITGVVNLRVEYDDAAHNLLVGQYCHLPTIDDDTPTTAHLNAGIAFMEQVIAGGGKIYIHCAGGIGRAPTMAVAYLVRHGLSVDDAIKLIRQTRPFINITPVQMAQLRRFEHRQLESQREGKKPG